MLHPMQEVDAARLTDPADTRPVDESAPSIAELVGALGLHARPAAVVARMLAAYDAKVRVNGANAASVLELMKLGAKQGVALDIEAEGPQAAEARDALVAAVEGGFGEV